MFLQPQMVSPERFTNYTKSVRENKLQPVGEGNLDAAHEALEIDDNTKAKEAYEKKLYMQAVQGASIAGANRGMPQRNLYQEQGYAGLQEPQTFQKQTILPFDEDVAAQANYLGIVQAYNPQLFKASTDMQKSIEHMAPQARQSLLYRGSLYTGVPQEFTVNSLYILNTRNRENSIYAFV